MTFALVLDLILAGLLVMTIGCCVVVHRRLGALRGEQGEMRQLIDQFSESTTRAENSLNGLKQAAEDSTLALGPRIDQAQTLISDLDMLNHRATKLANQLEPAAAAPATRPAGPKTSATPRRAEPAHGGPTRRPQPGGKSAPAAQSRTERDLIEALKASV